MTADRDAVAIALELGPPFDDHQVFAVAADGPLAVQEAVAVNRDWKRAVDGAHGAGIASAYERGALLLGVGHERQGAMTAVARPDIPRRELSAVARRPSALDESAFHGLAGSIVRALEPHTEADPAALLTQFLLVFGNVIGRSAHFVAEADQHHLNLNVVLVGTTAAGRKGTSFGRVRDVFSEAGGFNETHGLSSGEGLIHAVRDPDEVETREGGVATIGGVADKRLVIVEQEFAGALKVMGREGNSLSAQIRLAWDTGNLRTLVKTNPVIATGAHISIVGHITRDELLRYLSRTEYGNGFANRFLWVCARRSKILPEGGDVKPAALIPLLPLLHDRIMFASSVTKVVRDAEAKEIWAGVYGELTRARPGLLGAVTARADPYVMRIACIYALLDGTSIISRPHLEAALAVWEYCEDSARLIFGDSLGNADADRLLANLRNSETGMTREAIRDLFGRNKGGSEIDGMLELLRQYGLATVSIVPTGGRPAQRWSACRHDDVNDGYDETSP